jgi:hypothetical protein
MKTISETQGFRWQGGLYVACPLLLAVLFGLNLTLPSTWAVGAFYAVAIVAAIPTMDRRFIQEMSLASVLFLLWNAVAQHEGGAGLVLLFLNSVVGLLAVWAVLRLSVEIVAACEQQVRMGSVHGHGAASLCAGQGHLLTMCAWTKRVKFNGNWVPIEEFLDRELQIVVSHGVSDDLKASLIANNGSSGKEECGS